MAEAAPKKPEEGSSAGPPANEAKPAGGEAKAPAGKALLNGRHVVDPGSPLAEFDSPHAKAYAVQGQRPGQEQMFALVCQPGMPVRAEVMAALKGKRIEGVLKLVDWGPADWPPLGQICMLVIYEKPLGGRLADANNAVFERINEYDMTRVVIEPLLSGLLELDTLNVRHRSIRPHNMFFRDAEKQELVLGDCVTAPPGYDQPIIFERIHQAMAVPASRGAGSSANDLYALGVSIVILLLGGNPVAGISDDEMLYSKIEFGSYAFLCGERRIAISMVEPLRAILNDDSMAAWDLEDMLYWLEGRKLTPQQRRTGSRAEIGFDFAGQTYFNAATLARALAAAPAEAVSVAKEGKIENWLRRNLKDIPLAEAVASLAETVRAPDGEKTGGTDLLVCRLCMILDPGAPIRYRGFAFLPEGFGPALAVEMLHRGDNQVVAKIIAENLPAMWCAAQTEHSPDLSAVEKTFEKLKGYIQINDMGYGIERCLYELNPYLPCQSPLVVKEYVTEIQSLLPTLDEVSESLDQSRKPIDRHLAAFIAARFGHDLSPHLSAASDPDEATSIVGVLGMLAIMHWRLRHGPLKGLTGWVASLLGPAVATYQSRTTRREIEKETPKLARQGNLEDLFVLVDNQKRRKSDKTNFNRAVAEYAATEEEFRLLEASDAGQSESAVRLGQQVASMSSVVVSLLVITILVIMDIW